MEAIVPSKLTLDKYGLTPETWLQILHRQGGVCAVCRKLPETGRLNVDHDHVKDWKKLPPEERVRYVRGLLCYWCNKSYLGKGITVAKAENMVSYLKQFDSVRPATTSIQNKKATRKKTRMASPTKVDGTQTSLVESSEPDPSSSDSSSKPASPLGFPFSTSR